MGVETQAPIGGAQRTGPTGYRRRGRWALAAAGLAGAALVGCTAGCRPETPSWAVAAEEYVNAYNAAFQSGFTNTAPFYAEDGTFDGRFFMIPPATGPNAIVQALRDNFQNEDRDVHDATPLTRDEPLYLSADGAVDPVWMHADPYIVHLATAYTFSPGGITSEVLAGQVKGVEMYLGVPIAAMDPLPDGYLDAWASGDPAALRARYADDAVVRDSLAGITLTGSAAISAAAGASMSGGGLPRATLHEISGGGGPAYYLGGLRSRLAAGKAGWMVMLLSVDDGSGCPGDMAVAMSFDEEQRITREERYHRIDSLGRCATGSQTGWWDSLSTPDVPPVVRTGTMTLSGLEVAIWNGTPDPSPLVEWAVQRFADAGLTPPIPTSVTFLPRADDPWAQYGFVEGSSAPDLALALPAADACGNPECTQWPTWAKAAMLHQLAHVWIRRGPYTGPDTSARGPNQAAAFLRAHDMTWSDAAQPREEQGSQVAAETIAWGLMDEPYVVDSPLGSLTCGELAADFTLLTRAPADPAACGEHSSGSVTVSADAELDAQYPPPAPAPWTPVEDAHAAVTWFDTYASALRQGLANIPAFYAEDARVDHRALNAGIAVGRDSLLDLLGTMEEGALLRREALEALHVSASGAVTVDRISTALTRTMGAFAMTMGPTGIRSEAYAPSLQQWRRTFPKDERLLDIQLAMQAYRQAWRERSPDHLASLYAPQASITDDLLGIDVQGRTDVSALAGAPADDGGLAGLAWVSLPDMGGPAIFIAGGRARDAQLDTVVLLARAEGCLGNLALVLRLDAAGLIEEETRLHSVEGLSTCPRTRTVPAWWEAAEVPPAVAMVHTGTLQAADRSIEIFNGSPTLDEFVVWGVDQYAAAGLGTPAVDVIRFIGMSTDTCQRVAGLNLGTEITLCVDVSRAAPLLPKATLLHELGHAWMNQNLDQAGRERFVRASGKPAWASTTTPWGDRGVELAASTLSWALMDAAQPLNNKLGPHSCTELARLYEALVGEAPTRVPPCPADTSGGSPP